jgi:DNA ligase-1
MSGDISRIFKVLEKIQNLRTLREKLSALQSLLVSPHSQLLKEIVDFTYNYKKKYFVRAPVSETHIPTAPIQEDPNQTWSRFKELLTQLQQRPKDARMLVLQFLNSIPVEDHVKWYVRILNRDLKIGIGEDSLRKLFVGVIADVPVMLADLYDPKMKLPDEVIIEPKYDGVRVVLMVENGDVTALTRNGKRVENIENLLLEARCELPDGVYDCEAFDSSWNVTLSAITKAGAPNIHTIRLNVFDYLTLEEWRRRSSHIPLLSRKHRLEQVLRSVDCKYVRKVPYFIVDQSGINKYYERFTKEGFEGAIIKDPNSYYLFKRSNAWLKLKERDVQAYKVVGAEVGTGKYTHVLGALIVQDRDGTTFKVGGGFTDKQRKEFWENRNSLIGQCVEVVLFPSKQKASKASFPVFLRFRPDLGGEC